MGQIRGKKAHTDACNLRSLSSFGIPAAGQHILVSTGNSATEDGQGNFDAYVVGNGRDAATALELKPINPKEAQLYEELIGKEELSETILHDEIQISTGVINANTLNWLAVGNQNYKHGVVQVSGFSEIAFTATAGHPVTFAFLKSYAPATGQSGNLCEGASVAGVPKGASREYDLPEDCNFVYFRALDSGNNEDVPQTITLTSPAVKGAIQELEDSVTQLGGSIEGIEQNLNVLSNSSYEAACQLSDNIVIGSDCCYDSTNGKVKSFSRWSISCMIVLKNVDNSILTLSRNAAGDATNHIAAACFFDKDYNFIEATEIGSTTFSKDSMPSGAEYVAFSFFNIPVGVAISVGDYHINRPLVNSLIAPLNTQLEIDGKKLEVVDTQLSESIIGYHNYCYSDNGALISYNNWEASYLIDVSKLTGEILELSQGSAGSTSANIANACFYDSSFNFVGYVNAGNKQQTFDISTFPANTKYVAFSFYKPWMTEEVVAVKGYGLFEIVGKKLQENEGFGGKNIVLFGDSISEFSASSGKTYANYIEDISGAKITNVAIGGSQLRQRKTPTLNPTSTADGYAGLDMITMVRAACGVMYDSTHSYMDVVEIAAEYLKTAASDNNDAIIARLKAIDWSTIDAVIIAGGQNDWNLGGGNIGTDDSNDENTTLGALNKVIDLLLSTYPHLSLFVKSGHVSYTRVTIPNFSENANYNVGNLVHYNGVLKKFTTSHSGAWNESDVVNATALDWRLSQYFSDNAKVNGYTEREYFEQIKQLAWKRHIPFCDTYNEMGWNETNFSEYYPDNDNVHPMKGFEQIAEKIYGFLKAKRTFK